MINYSHSEKPYIIEVEGHAGFAEKGKDIVCASVSTAIIVSANMINKLGQKENIKVILEEGYFYLEVLNETKEIKAVCENLLYTLDELANDYSRYIKKKER